MDQQTTKGTPRVVRLNNDYTNEQLAKQRKKTAAPKRRFLGLILITVVVALSLPTYGLVKSFQALKESRTAQTKIISSSKEIRYQASSQAALIKNMQNPIYVQKYARARYRFTKSGEKVFTVPSSSTSSLSSQNSGN
ncbi:MAG: septum formation initiator family protein [Streptococcaceae bacterium]|jgi:cell division protein DivIC|nr:septum formation initiator family protein [Streptococcaceae bacterium]